MADLAETMPVTDYSSHRVHYLENSSYSHIFLVQPIKFLSKVDIGGKRKSKAGIGIQEIICILRWHLNLRKSQKINFICEEVWN